MADSTAPPPAAADQAKKKAKAKKMEKPEKTPEELAEKAEKAEKKKKKEKPAEAASEASETPAPPQEAAPAEEVSKPPPTEAAPEAPPAPQPEPAPAPAPDPLATEGEPAVNEAPPTEEQADEEAKQMEEEEEANKPEEAKAPRRERELERNIMSRITESKLKELEEAFELMDINSDGFLDAKDLQLTFVTLGRTPEDTEIMDMMEEAPKPMDFEGFVNLLGSRTIDLDPEDILMAALSLWDKDGKGLIDEEMFRMSLTGWGDKFTHEEVDIVLGDAPYYSQSGTPMINYREFCKQISSSAIKKS